jgi:segregation and condensation protein B
MSEERLIEDNAAVLDADYDDEETELTEETEKPGDFSLSDDLQVVSEENKESELNESDASQSAEEVETETAAEDDEEVFSHMAAVLEGLLFITGDEGISFDQAMEALGTDKEYTEKLFSYLQKYYTNEDRGIEIARFGNIYKFLSKAFVHEYAMKLFQLNKESKLSSAALETLAIIAYKQPVTRVEIEEIRGVGADVMLRKLEARGLIKEDGRSDAPGRPILYSVTDEFMDAFQLLSLDELPELPKFGEEQEESEELFNQ